MIYPRVLKSEWYMADVCNSIHASLEATKQWTVFDFENGMERDAYLHAFLTCQEIARRHDLKPKEILRALSDYHDALSAIPNSPFFSITRWFYDPAKARDRAVRVAFEVVDSLSKRFLL